MREAPAGHADWTGFGSRLKVARHRAGLSQRQLAKMLGRSNTTICNWEGGDQYPMLGEMYAIAHKLNTDPVWMVTGQVGVTYVNPAPAVAIQEIAACVKGLEDLRAALAVMTDNLTRVIATLHLSPSRERPSRYAK